MEKAFQLAVGMCSCLLTCNSVVNMLVMWLVLGLSFMVISRYHGYPVIRKSISPL